MLFYKMNSFYYFFYEEVEIEDPCGERYHVFKKKKLEVYNIEFIKVEFPLTYSHQKASLKRSTNFYFEHISIKTIFSCFYDFHEHNFRRFFGGCF